MAEKNAEKPDFDEIQELLDSELLQIDDEPLPAGMQEVKLDAVLNSTHETYGTPDVMLRKPYSELKLAPEGMEIYGGGENGAVNVTNDEVEITAFTNIGYGYNRNDDGFLVDTNSNTVVITDGVGGNKHGEVASNVALHVSGQKLAEPGSVDLKEIVQSAHESVKAYQSNNGKEYDNVGATIVATSVKDGKAEFVHAGDSKALMFRKGEIIYDSLDDNLLNYIKARLGKKTKKEALDYIYDTYGKNARPDAILQDLGHPDPVINFENGTSSKTVLNPHYHSIETRPGDIIVLASDGLIDNMETDEILANITIGLTLGKALNVIAAEIRTEVIKRMKSGTGKYDNITISIIQVKQI